jgi:hypothetical protein
MMQEKFMKNHNHELFKTPPAQIFLITSNLSAGTTGDSSFVTNTKNFYTGMNPNFSIEVISKEIRSRKEASREFSNQ